MAIYVDDVLLPTIVRPGVGQEYFRIAYPDNLTRNFELRAIANKPVDFKYLYPSI